MTYRDFQELNRKTAADKMLRDGVFSITRDQNADGYQKELVLKFIIRKLKALDQILKYYKLWNILYKRIIRYFKKRKIIPPSMGNIWEVDIADMKLLINYNIKNSDFFLALLISILCLGSSCERQERQNNH